MAIVPPLPEPRIPDRLPYLRMVLEQWCAMTTAWTRDVRYGGADEDVDCSYWYGERQNLGVLAGAAWRANCRVLVESAAVRSGRGGTRGASCRQGRSDMWVHPLGKEWRETSVVIEAKHAWIRSDHDGWHSRIATALGYAVDEVDSLSRSDAAQGMGLVFVVPRVPVSDGEHAARLFLRSVRATCEVDEPDLLAVAEAVAMPRSEDQDGTMLYPGVVLVGESGWSP